MAKPSIFSKDYARKMKQIRRRRFFIGFIVFLVIISGLIYFKNEYSSDFFSVKNTGKNKDKHKEKNNTKNTKVDNSKTEETFYSVRLNNGNVLKVMYDNNNGGKIIKYVDDESNSSNFTYSINPISSGVVICDNLSQSIIYVDINGNISDITQKEYASSDGTVFNKDDILKSNPNYIWIKTPMFIDNENIAYISQLPWFNQGGNKYLWIKNVSSPENIDRCLYVTGSNIEFGKIDSRGLNVNIDGKTEVIDGNGNVINN